MRFCLIVAFFLLPPTLSFSQTSLIGIVKDSVGQPISDVNIIAYLDGKVSHYSYSNEKGFYSLHFTESGNYEVTFSSVGFKSNNFKVYIDIQSKTNKTINIGLEKISLKLKEVFVTAKKPIIRKNDTVVFRTKFFLKGNEATVEDLLKQIPGLNVEDDGTIKVGNKEIEKLMVDGDDLFGSGYKILSRNMPAYPIEEVELLKNYSNNRLLKGIEQSNKVALNLKIDKGIKGLWFGNSNISYELESGKNYEVLNNLANFSNSSKHYLLSGMNNLGNNLYEGLDDLIRPQKVDRATSIGNSIFLSKTYDTELPFIEIGQGKTNFNDAELISGNTIFKPSPKTKIKLQGFLNWDERFFFRETLSTTNVSEVNFINSENYGQSDKNKTRFGKVEFLYDIDKDQSFVADVRFNSESYSNKANNVFNDIEVSENTISKNSFVDSKFSYTSRFHKKNVLLVTGRLLKEDLNQKYLLNQFIYEDLFPEISEANEVFQMVDNSVKYAGLKLNFLRRSKTGSLIDIQFGSEIREENLTSSLRIFEQGDLISESSNFQNDSSFRLRKSYVNFRYLHKYKRFTFIYDLDNVLFTNDLELENNYFKQNILVINPKISAEWKINSSNSLNASFSQVTDVLNLRDMLGGYILSSLTNFQRGTGETDQLTRRSVLLNYSQGSWNTAFLGNFGVSYNQYDRFKSFGLNLTPSYILADQVILDNSDFLSAFAKIDYFFESISSNLKLDISITKSNFKNVISNDNIRLINSKFFNYGLELKSAFDGIFNYHFGTKWEFRENTTNNENSFTNNRSFLDLLFIFNDKIDVQVKTERFFIGDFSSESNTYHFLDIDSRWVIMKNKLNLFLNIQNLLNTKNFINNQLTNTGSTTTEYRLLPRFLTIKAEYRF